MDIEALRRSYRPHKVHMLLVGESAPVSGKFFYHKSAMTSFTARAFEKRTPVSHLKRMLSFSTVSKRMAAIWTI